MEDIKVSVIVPVYNTAEYLRQCLDSIVGQTLQEIEIILVDDGSTDNSMEILREYESKDPRIKVLHQENKYSGVARNTGMKVAKGKYLVFWDSDDYFKPEALRLMYEQCEKDNAQICICGGRQFFEEQQFECPAPRYIRKKEIPEQIPYNIFTAPDNILTVTINVTWNKMFLRSFVESTGVEYQSVRNCTDVFFIECVQCLADSITMVNKPLVVYRKAKTFGLVASIDKGLDSALYAWTSTAEFLKEHDRFPERSFANRSFEDIIHLMSNTTKWETFRDGVLYMKKEGFEKLSIKRPADDDNEYFYIKWQNEACRRMYDDTPEEFGRWLGNIYFHQNAASVAKSRKTAEDNKKNVNSLKKDIEKKDASIEKLKGEKAAEKEKAKAEKERAQKEVASLKKKIDEGNKREKDLKDKLADQKEQLKVQKAKNAEVSKKLKDTRNSVSFKIGRVITWIPRKIKKLIKKK
ncbi:MAG: glycosyltransferase [Clostridiales bacterium]|nr:glycosyltransferase [Clostridiales bacterium]